MFARSPSPESAQGCEQLGHDDRSRTTEDQETRYRTPTTPLLAPPHLPEENCCTLPQLMLEHIFIFALGQPPPPPPRISLAYPKA